MINSGQKFQDDFQASCIEQKLCIDRVKNQSGGKAGVSNICDFIVFAHPFLYYLELKSYGGKRFPFDDLRPNQYEGLMMKSTYPSVYAGVLLNLRFSGEEHAFFVDIRYIRDLKTSGNRSISLAQAQEHGVRMSGTKKLTHFNYDVRGMLRHINLLRYPHTSEARKMAISRGVKPDELG